MTTTEEKGTAMTHALHVGTAGYYRCTCTQTFVTVEDFITHRDGAEAITAEVPDYTQQAKDRFMKALSDFYGAGMRLVEAWDDVDFNADDLAPLPPRLAPPLSLDEWLIELSAHYESAFSVTEWEKDGDPCNDCRQPANYDEANGWYYHVDPDAPPCFLMGSGPIEGHNDPKEVAR